MRSRIFLLFLLACVCAGASAGERGHVPKPTDLLDAPSASARPVAKLAGKQTIEILGRNGSWTRVQVGAASGWVRAIDVRLDLVAAARPSPVRVKPISESGIRGFSEEELLAASPGTGEVDKLKRMGVTAKDAIVFARGIGLKARKQDYFEGSDFGTLDIPDDFFDE